MADLPPDWAIDEALARLGVGMDQKPLGNWRNQTYAGAVKLAARLIATHEEPPVDSDLLIAREAAAQWSIDCGFSPSATRYRAGEHDANLNISTRAIKLARERGGFVMADWQPIETAPKDRSILVWCSKFAGEISGVSEIGEMTITFGGPRKSDYPGDNWWDDGGDYYACWCWPTHWMPLPEPPEKHHA